MEKMTTISAKITVKEKMRFQQMAKAKNVSISNLINQSINRLHVIDTNEMDKLEEMNRILIEIYNIREYLNRLEISNEYILLLLVRIETCLQKYLKED